MMRVIHPTDSMIRTAKISRELNGAEISAHTRATEALHQARARLVYRHLPWYRRLAITINAWISHA